MNPLCWGAKKEVVGDVVVVVAVEVPWTTDKPCVCKDVLSRSSGAVKKAAAIPAPLPANNVVCTVNVSGAVSLDDDDDEDCRWTSQARNDSFVVTMTAP